MKLSYNTIELTARRVFRTARSTTATSGSVIVTLSDGTITGIGEASPSRFYGETTETVLRYLERMRPAVDAAANESELMAELMSRGGKENPAARASLEIAAHDMMGKRCGAPLYAHFGLDPRATPLSTMSIGIDQPEVMLEKALEAKGFPLLKVKLDRETDASIVEKIKGATGARITVDVNCGWTRDEAVQRLPELERIGIELIEQPIAADDVEGLAYLRGRTSLPIFADESCPTSADIPRVAGAVDGIVIKLMKCGGLIDAVRMAEAARERGLKTLIGCMMETSLSLTAAAHISPLMDYADLDSGLLLVRDPYVGMTIDHGRMTLPDSPGLGVEPRGDDAAES